MLGARVNRFLATFVGIVEVDKASLRCLRLLMMSDTRGRIAGVDLFPRESVIGSLSRLHEYPLGEEAIVDVSLALHCVQVSVRNRSSDSLLGKVHRQV